MIGSSKINHQSDDLERLQELFDLGLNNTQIAKIYKTNSGESLSRIHISAIRRGERWNPNKRSFLMKVELEEQPCIETELLGMKYKTCISQLITNEEIYFVFLNYRDSKPIWDTDTPLQLKKPTKLDLLKYHNQFIVDEISGITEL